PARGAVTMTPRPFDFLWLPPFRGDLTVRMAYLGKWATTLACLFFVISEGRRPRPTVRTRQTLDEEKSGGLTGGFECRGTNPPAGPASTQPTRADDGALDAQVDGSSTSRTGGRSSSRAEVALRAPQACRGAFT